MRTQPSVLVMIVGAALGLLAAAPSYSQHYHMRTYREQDGVASNYVYNAAQDSLGNLWFGTRNGLCVFNGADWATVGREQEIGPRGEGRVSIDGAGRLWWIAQRPPLRILYREGDAWTRLPANVLGDDFVELADVQTWSLDGAPAQLAVVTRTGEVAYWDGEQWRRYAAEPRGVPLYSVTRVGARLFVAAKSGLFFLDLAAPDEGLRPVAWELPNRTVRGFGHDARTGVSWVVGDVWCARVVDDRLEKVYEVPDLPPRESYLGAAVAESPDGGVYIAEADGVHVFHPDWGLEKVTPAVELVSEGGLSILIDRENNVWLPSGRGISMIPSRRLACFNHRHGLLGDEVSAIHERADGTFVLGQRQGLTIFDGRARAVSYELEDWSDGRVSDLVEAPDGQLWVGANRRGVGLVRQDGTVDWQDLRLPIEVGVYALGFHAEYGMLVGTNRGLFHGRIGQPFEEVELQAGIRERPYVVRRIVPLSGDRVALATNDGGIFILDGGRIRHLPGTDEDTSQSAFAIFEAAPDELLVGTNAGLFRAEAERLVRVTSPLTEIRRPVYSILRAADGRYWFGTDNGVVVWDGRKLDRITARNGLLGHETNRDALIESRDGRIWIGTDSGLSVYRQDLDIPPAVAPILSMTAILLNGKRQPLDQPIRQVGPIGSLDFHFRAPSFTSEHGMVFRARIDGEVDGSLPLQVHAPGTLPLTNVPTGTFRLHIQARSPDGRESQILISPRITIVTPLWERWYMRTAMGLTVLLGLWLLFAFVAGRRHARRLEEVVRARTADLRRREVAALRETERLTGILESISDGVVVVDERSRVMLFNRAAESLVPGRTPLRLGMDLAEIVDPSTLLDERQRALYRRLIDEQIAIQVPSEPIAVQGDGGETTWYEVTAVPIGGADGGMVIAFRDITSRRQREQETRRAQKLESLGLLAGGIAHDFNNLLTILLGNLTLVETSPAIGPYEQACLGKMRHATERARSLTRQLLTFARGGGPVREPADLAPILRGAVSFSLSGTNVTFELDLPGDLWWAEVDSDQIHQVFNNLVINAFQAMPDGGTVGISARNLDPDAGAGAKPQVAIEVRDHGCGIPEEDLARIFDPYFTTKENGSGLGLAIAHSIIEKHGGRLSAESTVGGGSTFRIVLPACEKGGPRPAAADESAAVSHQVRRVMVMDDEPEIQTVLARMLARLGNECACASDGEEALRHFRRARDTEPFDCVILDLTVPGGMGGLETLEALRAIDPHISAVVTSGYSSDPVLSAHRRYGFQGILRKPFTPGDLEQALEQAR